ncbi:MAG: enoyl-CoA hydratase-related protein [Aliishimia sp.]
MAILERNVTNGIAHLYMNAPERLNALSDEMLEALQGTLDQLKTDTSGRAVIISGEGKAFCAGQELKQMTAARQSQDGGKAAFYQQIQMPLDQAYAYAGDAMIEKLMYRDTQEGIAAFLEKRDPTWEQ